MLKVLFKFGNNLYIGAYDMPLSEFIHDAPEWDIDFDSIAKIEVE